MAVSLWQIINFEKTKFIINKFKNSNKAKFSQTSLIWNFPFLQHQTAVASFFENPKCRENVKPQWKETHELFVQAVRERPDTIYQSVTTKKARSTNQYRTFKWDSISIIVSTECWRCLNWPPFSLVTVCNQTWLLFHTFATFQHQRF